MFLWQKRQHAALAIGRHGALIGLFEVSQDPNFLISPP